MGDIVLNDLIVHALAFSVGIAVFGVGRLWFLLGNTPFDYYLSLFLQIIAGLAVVFLIFTEILLIKNRGKP
jgi:hypothetical protein